MEINEKIGKDIDYTIDYYIELLVNEADTLGHLRCQRTSPPFTSYDKNTPYDGRIKKSLEKIERYKHYIKNPAEAKCPIAELMECFRGG